MTRLKEATVIGQLQLCRTLPTALWFNDRFASDDTHQKVTIENFFAVTEDRVVRGRRIAYQRFFTSHLWQSQSGFLRSVTSITFNQHSSRSNASSADFADRSDHQLRADAMTLDRDKSTLRLASVSNHVRRSDCWALRL